MALATTICQNQLQSVIGHTPPIIVPIDSHVKWLRLNPKYLPFLTLLGMEYVVSFSKEFSFVLKKKQIHTMTSNKKDI